MDIPKIYVSGEKKRMIFSADLPDRRDQPGQVSHSGDTYDVELAKDTESENEDNSKKGRTASFMTAALTLFFCAVTTAVVAVMLINSGKPAAAAITTQLFNEIYGRGSFQSPLTPPPAETLPDTDSNTDSAETSESPDSDGAGDAETDPSDNGTDAPPDTSQPPAEEKDAPEAGEALSHSIARLDLSAPSGDLFSLQNETKFTPNMATISGGALPIEGLSEIQRQYGSTAPAVLIIHTHGTESYLSEGSDSIGNNDVFRSDNTDENVVAVGRVMAETLSRCGVGVLHSTVMYDKDDYKGAYDASAAAVRDYLKSYPSIRYIFDVHRDSIVRADGTAVAPTSELYGKSSAQVMLVAGTDEGGAAEYDWTKNLTLAALIQGKMAERFPGTVRRINLRRAAFNQGIAPGYLLIEVGSHATTLSEAKRAAAATAVAISEVIGADTSSIDTAALISGAK